MDPRLIQQFVLKEEAKLAEKGETCGKRGRKPKAEKREMRKRFKSNSRDDFKYDITDTEEEKEEESPKPAFLMQTWSGRNPKPTRRYEEKDIKRKRHQSASHKTSQTISIKQNKHRQSALHKTSTHTTSITHTKKHAINI